MLSTILKGLRFTGLGVENSGFKVWDLGPGAVHVILLGCGEGTSAKLHHMDRW